LTEEQSPPGFDKTRYWAIPPMEDTPDGTYPEDLAIHLSNLASPVASPTSSPN
jgi:hypothetical protein